MTSIDPHGVQTAALRASAGTSGYAYYMEQGLGKTGTTLLEFRDLVKQRLATRLVVLCPNSFKGGWADEIEKWGFDFFPFVFESGADAANNWFLRQDFDKPPVLVVNYEAIRSESTQEYILRFINGKNAMIAADESIQIAGYSSKKNKNLQTKAALRIAPHFAYRRVLSGKPIKQGPHDLWAQMRFIGALEGRNFYAFKAMFCRTGGFQGKQVIGAMNEDILAEFIDPYIFRALKKDWTDMPPKTYGIRSYDMTKEMREMYRSMEDDFMLFLKSGDVVTIEVALTKYIKLAQIQAGFIFDENGKYNELVTPGKNPRLNAFAEFYENEVPGKMIGVYNHKPVRDLLAERFAKEKPVFLHGGMTGDEIKESKDRFNNDRDCRTIFITKSAKYGHTLLGDQTDSRYACSNMAFYENTYALDDRSQLEDRPHRHGQLQASMDYMDFATTSLDKSMIKSLQRKENIYQSVFAPIAASLPGSSTHSE